MRKRYKKRRKKEELPPGKPGSEGEKETPPVKITIMNYDQELLSTYMVRTVEECFPYKDQPTVTWINVDGIHNPAVVEQLGTHYGLHPLMIEDILNTEQRPKIEVFDEYIVILLKMHTYNETSQAVDIEQVSFVIGKGFVITFQEEKEGDVFDPVRNQIRNKIGRIRKAGADYLAYALIDAVVDSYFDILERFGEQIEIIEEKLLGDPRLNLLQNVHFLKRELIFLRKSAWPLRNMVSEFERQGAPLIDSATTIYLRDLYDQIIHIIDTIEIFRDMLTGILEIYLSSMSNKMNEIMKFLTIIGTIFIPLTFIAGVYGMNFHYMPELTWKWGYFAIWAVMLSVGLGLLAYFNKKKWL